MLYETFRNVISIVTRRDYDNCIDKVWNKLASVYGCYKIFNVNMYFTEIAKLFKQLSIHYINKP